MNESREQLDTKAKGEDRFTQSRSMIRAAEKSGKLTERQSASLQYKLAGEQLVVKDQSMAKSMLLFETTMGIIATQELKYGKEYVGEMGNSFIEGAVVGMGLDGTGIKKEDIKRDKFGVADLSGISLQQLNRVNDVKFAFMGLFKALGQRVVVMPSK